MTTLCLHCRSPLPPTARRHAQFCSPAHRAAHFRASMAARMPRERFLRGVARDKTAAGAVYVEIVPDKAFSGMFRLKRTDGTLSDMVNLTRAKDGLAEALRNSCFNR